MLTTMPTPTDGFAERMASDELDQLRAGVDCRAVLDAAGWDLDSKESTRGAVKYRNGAARIVIVTHEGKGWFDPLNDRRGDVLSLAQHVWGGNLGHARKALRPLAGISPRTSNVRPSAPTVPIDAAAGWGEARRLCHGSQAWSYLVETRGIPSGTVERAMQDDVLREGIYGTVLARHQSGAGLTTGWEMRGPRYRGFAKGGTKTLFLLGPTNPCDRLVVTESAIDALSLATIEDWPIGTMHVSTGGGYGPATVEALQIVLLLCRQLVAATDQGTGGDVLAHRLSELAATTGVEFSRLQPGAKDWNDQLRGV